MHRTIWVDNAAFSFQDVAELDIASGIRPKLSGGTFPDARFGAALVAFESRQAAKYGVTLDRAAGFSYFWLRQGASAKPYELGLFISHLICLLLIGAIVARQERRGRLRRLACGLASDLPSAPLLPDLPRDHTRKSRGEKEPVGAIYG